MNPRIQLRAPMRALPSLLGAGCLLLTLLVGPSDSALAAEGGHADTGHGSSGGHAGLPRGHQGGRGGSLDHADGHDHETDAGTSHTGGKGRGGDHASADHTPRAGRGGGGHAVVVRVFGGQRPVWAREGIPPVELGRLNVARAPDHVLERAELEALSRFSPQMTSLYKLDAATAADRLRSDYSGTLRIDSPLQNLALYKDIMVFGRSQLPGVQADQLELAAIFLGSAADKTMPITEDTVIALNRILGLVDLNDADRAALTGKADTVRAAILAGHGETTH